MSFTSAGIRVWDSTEAASIHGASAAQGTSLNTKVIGVFADETARNAAFAALSSAQKKGIIAYVDSLGGHTYWRAETNTWESLAGTRVLYSGAQAGAADQTGTAQIGILDPPPVTLAPGNRIISVSIFGICENLSSTLVAMPRLFFTGTSVGYRDQRHLPAGNAEVAMTISQTFFASGVLDLFVWGLNVNAGQLHWRSFVMNVIDYGPA